jgi:hypothetical protein
MALGRPGAALLLGVFLAVSTHAAAPGAFGNQALTILDVPFLAQGEQLCGGAAAAMVLRYWGERETLAEDFASLVDERDSGIRGDVLADAVRRWGWIVHSFRGDIDGAKDHLARGRPLIVLIEDQPGRYHYVVLVAWPDGHVILHDPARAPFRTLADPAFSTAWAATNLWTLLILPDPDAPRSSPGDDDLDGVGNAAPTSRMGRCELLVGEGIRLAQTGDSLAADTVLSTALAQCPTSGLGARELAGLRFLQSRWHEAAQLAARAAALAPDDPHAWRLLASSRFIQDDVDGALRAWNRIGRPGAHASGRPGLWTARRDACDLGGLAASMARGALRVLSPEPKSHHARLRRRAHWIRDLEGNDSISVVQTAAIGSREAPREGTDRRATGEAQGVRPRVCSVEPNQPALVYAGAQRGG